MPAVARPRGRAAQGGAARVSGGMHGLVWSWTLVRGGGSEEKIAGGEGTRVDGCGRAGHAEGPGAARALLPAPRLHGISRAAGSPEALFSFSPKNFSSITSNL